MQCTDSVRIGRALETADALGSPCYHRGRRELVKLSALKESSSDYHKAMHGRHRHSLLWMSQLGHRPPQACVSSVGK